MTGRDRDATLPPRMRAMRLHELGPVDGRRPPLQLDTMEVPQPGPRELLVRVSHCGVCHTELDEIEGRAAPRRLPIVPGHQVVGQVAARGTDCQEYPLGRRVGVGWIHRACGDCHQCHRGYENLCPRFRACGCDVDGGYAEFMTVPEAFAHPIPEPLDSADATLMLCAGAVGLRALNQCRLDDGQPIGLIGFGASAHLVLPMARYLYPRSEVMVFARNPDARSFALRLGAHWAGDIDDTPPSSPMAIIDTTPAWRPVLAALEHLSAGGRVVINALRKETADRDALNALDFERHLWREKHLTTVANVTREDVRSCLRLAAEIPLRPEAEVIPLEHANRVLADLRHGGGRGGKVLRISEA